MDKKDFNKLLLTELRLVEGLIDTKDPKVADLESALVDNENLKALGYELTQEGLAKLSLDYSREPEMTPLYKRIMDIEPGIEVSPMYPDFPTQVLEMEEIDFRTHQAIHYLTTYGVETLLGVDVKEGWLPEFEEQTIRVDDEKLVENKVLEYLSPQEVDSAVISRLLERAERLEKKEVYISKVVSMRTDLEINEIPFKENIGLIYGDTLLNGMSEDRDIVFQRLAEVSKHPGDVLDVLEYIVVKNKYKHLKTSVKRGFVNLIESFEPYEVEENLANNKWSRAFLGKGSKARSINRNISLIDYLSFNRFSKKESIREVVNKMKDGDLYSWNQKLETYYKLEDYEAVRETLLERPGVYFRQINRLLNLGVSYYKVSEEISSVASELKTQSIISALNNFEGRTDTIQAFYDSLIANLESKDIKEIRDKKVYIDEGVFDLSKSKLEITDKFAEGGYITNGMAVKIPEGAEYLRFFTYWNDDNDRIDIDLHGVSVDSDGLNSHIGWNGKFKDDSLVHSGDITHSDAAEYIDLDIKSAIDSDIKKVQLNINSYTGVPFSEIEEVFTGLMVLGGMGKEVNLFDPKNVIFRHDLNYHEMSISYGHIDLIDNVIYVGGETKDTHNDTDVSEKSKSRLTIRSYINVLLATQGSLIVNNEEDADVILRIEKSDDDKSFSLIDENYFIK